MGISVVYAAFSIALVLATSAGRIISEYLTWHVAMEGAFGFAVLTSALLVVVMPKSARGTDGLASPANQLRLLREPVILFGVLIFLFGIGAVYTFYGYVAPYLETELRLTTVQSGTVLLVFGCICFVSDLLSGVFDLRFGMKALPPIFVGLAAALFGLWLAGQHVVPALATVFVIALLMYSFSIPCITMFMDVARRKHPGALIFGRLHRAHVVQHRHRLRHRGRRRGSHEPGPADGRPGGRHLRPAGLRLHPSRHGLPQEAAKRRAPYPLART